MTTEFIKDIKKNRIELNTVNTDDSPKTKWGRLVVYLREHNNIALHIVCGDITNVGVNGDTFEIRTTEKYVYDILNENDNKNQLKKAFEYIGYNNHEVVMIQKQKNMDTDIETLKRYFGDNIQIKK